ncbi:MAG: sigma-70 family RNA polymerase sigma factor [Bacteroidetes bacterium]|nr:sigma-70 family RNA polymerase sigma factor [Bacteroidota bacterium]
MALTSSFHISANILSIEETKLKEAKADPASFEYFYTKYHEQIFRYIYQRIDSKDTAADLTSQVFMKALMNINSFQYRGIPFSSWLYRIAMNEMNQMFRKKKVQHTLNMDLEDIKDMAEEIESGDKEEQIKAIINEIDGLKDEDVLLIEMRYFEKRPFREIAEILNITENNAKVKVYRILDKIKRELLQTTSKKSK